MEQTIQGPVYLSPDMFRHEPVAIRFASLSLGRFRLLPMLSRYVRREGMIVEVPEPLPLDHPFKVGDDLEVRIYLPFEPEALTCLANLSSITPRAISQRDREVSLLCFQFVANLSAAVASRLSAHDLMVQTALGRHRAARLPVQLPVACNDSEQELWARDLSMTGMFVSGALPVRQGQRVKVSFRLPLQTQSLSLEGSVVWQGRKRLPGSERSVEGFGVQFEKATPQVRVALATFCSRSTLFPEV